MVNVSSLWSIPSKGHVKICVFDTGYDFGHPDLPSVNATGYNTEMGIWNVDEHLHGTHCAGTIGAIGNNGNEFNRLAFTPVVFLFH